MEDSNLRNLKPKAKGKVGLVLLENNLCKSRKLSKSFETDTAYNRCLRHYF